MEFAISMCYFRVPEFREEFISLLTNREHPNTKSIAQYLALFQPSKVESEAINMLVDWQRQCYDYIPENIRKKSADVIKSVMQNKEWKDRIEKAGLAFFLIARHWADYVKHHLAYGKKSDLNWN
jgi:hypothetical protein